MTAVLLRRLLRLLVVCFGISLITFLLLHLSGDPVAMILPEATEADRATLRETLGLNRPLLVQYGSFIGRAVQGDFGQSFFHRSPALPLVFERMPTTLLLTFYCPGSGGVHGYSGWHPHLQSNATRSLITWRRCSSS